MPTSKHPSQFDRQDRHGCPRRSLHQLISKFEVPNASWHASSATPTGMPDRNHPLPRLTTRPDRAEENGSQGLCPGSSTSPVSQIAQLDVLSPHGQASGLNCERAHTDPQLRTRTNEPSANDKISPIGLGDISNMNTTKLPVALRRGRFEKAVFLGSSKYWLPGFISLGIRAYADYSTTTLLQSRTRSLLLRMKHLQAYKSRTRLRVASYDHNTTQRLRSSKDWPGPWLVQCQLLSHSLMSVSTENHAQNAPEHQGANQQETVMYSVLSATKMLRPMFASEISATRLRRWFGATQRHFAKMS